MGVNVSRCFLVVVLSLATIAAALFFTLSSSRRSATEIVGELPKSARLTESEFVKYGFDDVTYLFAFECSDSALRRQLQQKWELNSHDDADSVTVGFTPEDRPHWWPLQWQAGTRSYHRSDDRIAQYWSVWEVAVPGKLYVEVGTW